MRKIKNIFKVRLFQEYKYFLLFFVLTFIDQITKFWADSLGLVVENNGVSFGLMDGFGGMIYIQLILLLVVFYILNKSVMPVLEKTLFLSGIVSNSLDRIFMGGVVRDWLVIPVVGLKNNLADIFIFTAIVLYIIKYGYEYRNNLRR